MNAPCQPTFESPFLQQMAQRIERTDRDGCEMGRTHHMTLAKNRKHTAAMGKQNSRPLGWSQRNDRNRRFREFNLENAGSLPRLAIRQHDSGKKSADRAWLWTHERPNPPNRRPWNTSHPFEIPSSVQKKFTPGSTDDNRQSSPRAAVAKVPAGNDPGRSIKSIGVEEVAARPGRTPSPLADLLACDVRLVQRQQPVRPGSTGIHVRASIHV